MENNKPFRLKDPMTNLYYVPRREIKVRHPESKHSTYTKSNLSKKGKIYFTNPQKHIGSFLDHAQIFWSKNWSVNSYSAKSIVRPTQEWVIEYI